MRTILIIIFIYMLLRTFARYIMPYMIKGIFSEISNQNKESKLKDGEVKIKRKSNGKTSAEGEFIEYEEVK